MNKCTKLQHKWEDNFVNLFDYDKKREKLGEKNREISKRGEIFKDIAFLHKKGDCYSKLVKI